jgi:membrane protease subunit HflK
MTEHNHKHHHRENHDSPDNLPPVELDAASRSLSEALRISFVILKIIMIVLVVLFLVSGFKTVGSDEQALVLRFGKICGVGENRILKPKARPYWIFPYPLEEIVKIPVKKVVSLDIRSFWYYQSDKELLAESQGEAVPVRSQTLDPVTDGYCLTRSEKQTDAFSGSDGSDYNIIHSKWQLRYRIKDPEQFFKNVFVKNLKPGDVYFDIMTESITPLLKNLLENAVVTAMVNYTIDEAVKSQDRIPKHVKKILDEKLDNMKSGETKNMCGIEIESVLLTDITWPRQVNDAFRAAHNASQDSRTAVSNASTYAQNKLNEAAGPVAEQLYTTLRDANVADEVAEALWTQVAGDAQQRIFDAMEYRTKVVAAAKANAGYFRSLLPEYRKHPDIVVQSIYREAIEAILSNADEKFVVEPTEGEEIRILVSRDPTIKRKPKKEEGKENSKK